MTDFRRTCDALRAEGATVVPEHQLKALLRELHAPVPRGRLCTRADEAVACARDLHPPFVLKLASDRILHKSELGGIRLGLDSPPAVEQAFIEMSAALHNTPGYRGLLLEEQAPAGVEIITGLQNDPAFGPVLMLGLGGVFTDLFQDVTFRLLPIPRDTIREALQSLKGWPLLAGFRGAAPIAVDHLVDAIQTLAAFGTEYAALYSSVDFNPIIATPQGCTVADAKLVLASADPVAFDPPRTDYLERFFRPASVAVIGASATQGKIGNTILDTLHNLAYQGAVYPINPGSSEIMGLTCYPSLSALPAVPDLVVIAVDLKLIPALIAEMGAVGSHNAFIVSGGGRELGGERAAIEHEIATLARQHAVRIIGPNCIGSFDGVARFDSFFYPRERMTRPQGGRMSFITQSGTWGCGFLELSHDLGVAKMVSYGNRVDVDEGDLIAYLAEDPDTAVIGSYIEGLETGRKFLSAVAHAHAQGKPVAVFKTGRNPVAAKAAVSHTGAYGGSYQVYEGVLAAAGVILTDSFHELHAACEALALQPPARGNRAALVSNGAGPMVNAIDLFPSRGLTLTTLTRASVETMQQKFSFFYICENPVDVTGSATAADYEFVIATLLDDANVDIIMPYFVFQNSPLDASIIERLEVLNRRGAKPIVACTTPGPCSAGMITALKHIGVPAYTRIAEWTAAASALVRWGTII